MTADPPDLSFTRCGLRRARDGPSSTRPSPSRSSWRPGGGRPAACGRSTRSSSTSGPGGDFQRFVEVFPDDPSIRAEVHIDLTDVAEGRVLDGVIRVSGFPGGFEPFDAFRFEFHDELDGRTCLAVRQWLPPTCDSSHRGGLAPELRRARRPPDERGGGVSLWRSRIKGDISMRPLRYSINVTLDGCCHHEAGLPPDEESMRYWTAAMERADALLFGRVTYEMMESAWRRPATGMWPDWMGEWEIPFAGTIDRAKKYVVSSTLSGVDWNAELVRGDVGQAVQRLKQEPGEGLWVGGVTLPLALADLGLIDEYEFVVQPVLAGHGPTLLAGLASASSSSSWIAMSSGRGRSPCDTSRAESRRDVICAGTFLRSCAGNRREVGEPVGLDRFAAPRRRRSLGRILDEGCRGSRPGSLTTTPMTTGLNPVHHPRRLTAASRRPEPAA